MFGPLSQVERLAGQLEQAATGLAHLSSQLQASEARVQEGECQRLQLEASLFTISAQLEEARDATAAAAVSAAAENCGLQQELDQVRTAASEERASSLDALARAEAQLAAADERCARASEERERTASEAMALREQVDQLQEEAAVLRDALEHASEQAATASAALAERGEECEALAARLQQVEAAHARDREEAAQASADHASLAREQIRAMDELSDELTAARRELLAARTAATAAEANASLLQESLAAGNVQTEAAHAGLASAIARNQELEAELHRCLLKLHKARADAEASALALEGINEEVASWQNGARLRTPALSVSSYSALVGDLKR